MSLISCKECKNKISKTAKTCPHCGAQNIIKLKQDYIVGVAIVIFLCAVWFLYPSKITSPPIQTEIEATTSPKIDVAKELLIENIEDNSRTLDPSRESVKQHFISEEERTTKYARWKNDSTFQVLVFDDGSKRDGYAQYVCLILYEYGFTGENVTAEVIGWHEMMQEKHEKILGSQYCNAT